MYRHMQISTSIWSHLPLYSACWESPETLARRRSSEILARRRITVRRCVAGHCEGDECLVGVQKRKSSHALVVDFGAKDNLRRVQNGSSIFGPKRYFGG